jgi:hypothetical protein
MMRGKVVLMAEDCRQFNINVDAFRPFSWAIITIEIGLYIDDILQVNLEGIFGGFFLEFREL